MTKVNQLIEKIGDKWHIKVICLLIAVFIYMFHQVSTIERKSFPVTLNVIEDGSMIHVSELPPTISVSVRTSIENIPKITSADFRAYVKLDYIEEPGEYTLPINITISDRLQEMDTMEIKLRPETVNVKVERKAVKYVSIVPTIIGQVAEGYEIENITVNPSTVEVRGAESVLKNIDSISTTKVNVSNASKDFTVNANYLEIDKRITLDTHGPYKVTMKVVPVPGEKVFNSVGITVKNLNPDYIIESEIPAVDVLVKGDIPVLADYSLSSKNVILDLSTIQEEGNYEIPVKINLPVNIKMLSSSVDKVNVKVKIKTVEKTENEETDETLINETKNETIIPGGLSNIELEKKE